MPDSLDEYLKNRRQPEDINFKHKSGLKSHDKMAVRVTGVIGSMYAVYFLTVIILAWMLAQKILSRPFDPYPFAFLLFITNIIQLLLIPLIMVGQNIQARHSELRAQEEFKTTQTILKDIETIITHLTSSADASSPGRR